MGRSYRVRTTVRMTFSSVYHDSDQVQPISTMRASTPAEWHERKRYGRPGYGVANDVNLERYVREFERSTTKGGPNDHLTQQTVQSAKIVDEDSGTVLATYAAPMFQVVPPDDYNDALYTEAASA